MGQNLESQLLQLLLRLLHRVRTCIVVEEDGSEFSPRDTRTAAYGVGDGSHLAAVDICRHSFTVRKQLMVDDTGDIPPDAEKELLPEAVRFWPRQGYSRFRPATFFSFVAEENPLLVAGHQLVKKGLRNLPVEEML